MGITGKDNYGCDSGFRQLHHDMILGGTSAVPTEPPQIDFDKLAEFSASFKKSIVDSFMGLPVRVDPSLAGMRYYMCVSPELMDAIKKG